MTALNPNYIDYDPDFNETQYQLIKSISVAQRVVKSLALDKKGLDAAGEEKSSNILTGTISWFKDLFATILHIGGQSPRPVAVNNTAEPKKRNSTAGHTRSQNRSAARSL